MRLLHFVEAFICFIPIADKRMKKQGVESCFVTAGDRRLDCQILIILDRSHKADYMAVYNLADGHGNRAVSAYPAGNLDYIIGLKEGQSIAVFDIDDQFGEFTGLTNNPYASKIDPNLYPIQEQL